MKRAGASLFVVEVGSVSRLLYPGNVDLILILILVLTNWVEGVLKFTYVQRI